MKYIQYSALGKPSLEALHARAAARSMGTWLQSVDWDLFGTFTFRYPADAETALGHFEKYANDRLGRHWRSPLAWVAFTEPTADRHHVHALLRPTRRRRPRLGALQAGWVGRDWYGSYGFGRVEPVRDPAGACHYVSREYGLPGRAFAMSRPAVVLLHR